MIGETAQNAPAVAAPAFDPAAWLARYKAAGGWWSLTPDRLWFGWPVETFDAAMAVPPAHRVSP